MVVQEAAAVSSRRHGSVILFIPGVGKALRPGYCDGGASE